MARKVKISSSVRSAQDEFRVPQLCEDRDLHKFYWAHISWSYNAWIDLEPEDCENLILTGLTMALQKATWLESDLKARFTLPAGWTADEANWDRYRQAIAATLLQTFYDSLT